MSSLSSGYWDQLYKSGQTTWDIGYISSPLKVYFDQLTDKSIKILIPGAGNAYEAEYLFENGFDKTFILDFSYESIKNFKSRCPEFPDNNLINDNFFEHFGQYELIIEQTFSVPFQEKKELNMPRKCFHC